jgi:molybdate transport system ATP-binding protein
MSLLHLRGTLERPEFRLSFDETIELSGTTAVFGPSGAGKTSLLRILAGLERCRDAYIALDQTIWQAPRRWLPPHRRRVGYVFQDARLFPHMTVAGNLRFALRHAESTAGLALEEVVAAFDLGTLLRRAPASLSGGEAQRVALARALLSQPRLLLMDEPLSSLDAARKREILPYIEQLPSRFDIPVIYVTHNADELIRLADHVVVIEAGAIAARGSVEEIFGRTDLLALFGEKGAGSVLSITLQGFSGGMTQLGVGSQKLRIAGRIATLGAHPRIHIDARDVVIATEPVTHVSIRNSLRCTLLSIEQRDEANVDLLLDVESQRLRALITTNALEELRLRTGMQLFALIKSVAVDRGL